MTFAAAKWRREAGARRLALHLSHPVNGLHLQEQRQKSAHARADA